MIGYQKELESKLWVMMDDLRSLDVKISKNYVLGLIFYKFISEKLELFINKELESKGVEFTIDYEDEELKEVIVSKAKENLGYFIEPEFLFNEIAIKAKNGGYIIDDLKKALKSIEESTSGQKSENAFINIFEDVKLGSELGSDIDRNFLISRLMIHLYGLSFRIAYESHIAADLFEYLMDTFCSHTGKAGNEFYTPKQISKILAKIVTKDKEQINSVYDPTCGSGSLLLKVSEETNVKKFYGQEINSETYNLARMNMIIHNINYENFDLRQGNTLENPQHLGRKFDAIVANPPFSMKWPLSKEYCDDERFRSYNNVAPSKTADFAFIQHMIYQLDEKGVMAVVMPHGILFRGGNEGKIRKYLIEEMNYLDAVIGLPANIFHVTAISSVILAFKKSRKINDNIIFIDASKDFERAKPLNIIRDKDIEKILEAYTKREDIDKFAHAASLEEVRENDYNLNIPRYVDTFKEELIDKKKLKKELVLVEKEIITIDEEIMKYCKELGIEVPIFLKNESNN